METLVKNGKNLLLRTVRTAAWRHITRIITSVAVQVTRTSEKRYKSESESSTSAAFRELSVFYEHCDEHYSGSGGTKG